MGGRWRSLRHLKSWGGMVFGLLGGGEVHINIFYAVCNNVCKLMIKMP
jgi:hypothetical protein